MDDEYAVAPLTPLRKIIAARMAEAKRTIPHFRLTRAIQVDALLQARTQLVEQRPDEPLSLNDLLIKACATALLDVPDVNIQWVDGSIRRYRAADISVVVAVPGGLSTPIVRNADTKPLRQIAGEMRDLTSRATTNALRMDEIQGGSFSISNLGMHGVDQFDAIINPPQCAILALGRARECCVVVDRQITIATVMQATLSVDHRALDGAVAARFLAALSERIARPAHLIETAHA